MRQAAAAALHYTGVLGAYRRALHRRRGLILTYHRVIDDRMATAALDPGMYVTKSTFERHLQVLRRTYHLVTIDQMGRWLAGQELADRPPCALTFDDGWADNYEVAFPILHRQAAPATVFLITGSVGAAGMLDWPQVKEMERAGIAFGSHTVTHAQLGLCNSAQIRQELRESRECLVARLERPSRWFCFPKGSHSDIACSIAREYYAGALTTEPGWVSHGDDPFRLRRINMHEDMTRSAPLFAWKIALLR